MTVFVPKLSRSSVWMHWTNIEHLWVQLTKHFDQRLSNVKACRPKPIRFTHVIPILHQNRFRLKDANLRWTNLVSPHSAQDYFTDSNRKVHKDPLQSYQLLYGRENGTHTVLAFSRNLQTCDDNDKVITVGLTTCIITSGSISQLSVSGSLYPIFGACTKPKLCNCTLSCNYNVRT